MPPLGFGPTCALTWNVMPSGFEKECEMVTTRTGVQVFLKLFFLVALWGINRLDRADCGCCKCLCKQAPSSQLLVSSATSAHLYCWVLGMENPFKAEPPVHTKAMLLPTSHARRGALQVLGNRGTIRQTIIQLSHFVKKKEVQTIV